MAFVASFKNPLEIESVFLQCFTGPGGDDEANDEGELASDGCGRGLCGTKTAF